jgi:predicted porin
MKKSLIAMAVLATSGAAMAQSSVTLYGLVDTYLGIVKSDSSAGSLTQTKLDSGGVNGSRWGLKGSEDLGGGLKANFNLEGGFSTDTGAAGQNSTLFGRQSWVGFSGGFGAVKLGLMPTPFDDVSGTASAAFDSALSPLARTFRTYNGSYNNEAGTGALSSYTIRTSNTIKFESANYSGFSGAASYSLGENKTATVDAGYKAAFNLGYAAGPVAVNVAYQAEQTDGSTETVDYARLNASYDFGVAKLLAAYGKASNVGGVKDADADEWTVGVDVPVTTALTLSGGYAHSKDNSTLVYSGHTVGDAKRTGYSLAAKYTLSKRTFLYGGYSHGTTDFADNTSDTKVDLFAFGVQHRF